MVSRIRLAKAMAVSAWLMGTALAGTAQVLVYPGPARPLAERFAWARDQARARGFVQAYWVGYGIRRLMGEWSYIGWYSGRRPSLSLTLDDLINGRKTPLEKRVAEDQAVRGTAAQEPAGAKLRTSLWPGEKPERRVWKELGILELVTEPGTSFPGDFRISNLSGAFDFAGFPFIWLGMAEDAESLGYLIPLYDNASKEEDRLSVVRAVGLHRNAPLVVPFIERILSSKQAEALRAEAAECLGEQDDPRALEILLKIIRNDSSPDVREHAVWGLVEMELPAAVTALISLALSSPVQEVRSAAVRGLADKATEETVRVLEKIAAGEKDAEVQAEAVRAFADLPGKAGLPYLISLARTHAELRVRKEAIETIGEIGGPDAVKILTEMVRQSAR